MDAQLMRISKKRLVHYLVSVGLGEAALESLAPTEWAGAEDGTAGHGEVERDGRL